MVTATNTEYSEEHSPFITGVPVANKETQGG